MASELQKDEKDDKDDKAVDVEQDVENENEQNSEQNVGISQRQSSDDTAGDYSVGVSADDQN